MPSGGRPRREALVLGLGLALGLATHHGSIRLQPLGQPRAFASFTGASLPSGLGELRPPPGSRCQNTSARAGVGVLGVSGSTLGPGLLPVVLLGLVVLAVRDALGRTEAVLDFVSENTNIRIVDTPIPHRTFRAPYGFTEKHSAEISWHIRDDDVLHRVLADGGVGFGETYVDGEWQTNDIEDLCGELLKLEGKESQLGFRAAPLLSSIFVGKLVSEYLPNNTLEGSAAANVHQHYDLAAWGISEESWTKFYELMLGPTMQYTCAYFTRPDMSLDEAQRAKMALVAHKLDLQPGMQVLDIGCGFGAMAFYLASEFGVHVTGVTLSENQAAYARSHFAHPNVQILLQDYRATSGQFDRVYSIGMFEQVGRRNTAEYFEKCDELLKEDGLMLLHTIGVNQSKVSTGRSFIGTYVFPGCELPHFRHFAEVSEAGRWHVEDWQGIGKGYARTLRSWLHNLGDWTALGDEPAFEGRFRRLWEYWQLSSAASFDRRRTTLWQILYSKVDGGRPDDSHHARIEPSRLPAHFPPQLMSR